MRPRINLVADFDDGGGWGRHARGFGAALARRAHVALCRSNPRPAGQPHGDVALDYAEVPLRDAAGVALGSVPFLPLARGTPRVLATVWETSRVPPAFVRRLRNADAVWVPTAWGRAIFADSGVPAERVHVVPEGVDTKLFRPAEPARERERERFRFLCVGKWEERKNVAGLVRAFAAEFAPSEPVELVMHCQNIYLGGFHLEGAIAHELRRVRRARARVVASGVLSLPELIALMQDADAFVLPTRAEAWGLPILEAMACGLACIVTDYGGHRAFADATNSYLIGARMTPVGDPSNFDPRLDWGVWAEPDLAHLRELMRRAYERRDELKARGEAARRTALRWTWDGAARAALGALGAA